MTPIQLLEKELKDLERNLNKSLEAYKTGRITHKTFELHLKNLGPQILEFRNALTILNLSK